jgi:hypothetical protein
MSTVRVEYCPDCGGMVGEGYLYVHRMKYCPQRRGSGTLSASAELVADRAGAPAQKTSSQPGITTTKNGNWETP